MLTDATINALPPVQAMGLIDADATVFVSAGIFLVFYFVMTQVLFKPYLGIVEKRRQLTGGASTEADALAAKADAVLNDYEESLSGARTEAAQQRSSLRAKGESDQVRIVGAAHEQASASLAARRIALAAEVATAEQQVDVRAQELSSAIVQRVSA
ncbi:MAG: F-type H+-transporting ATPase subunit b [Bradymonadia bacterium]|jgi:F-type H+-transporting ATPase subunit b